MDRQRRATVRLAITNVEVTGPGTLLVTTDDLHDVFADPEALAAAVAGARDPTAMVDTLARHLLARGAGDDFTAVAIPIGHRPLG